MKKPNFKFTPEGYRELERERAELLEKRPEVLARMVAAREQGDLSENAGYHAAKEEVAQIDRRVRELADLLRFGEAVSSLQSEVVDFGSLVIVENGKEIIEFTIVSALEADPSKGKISDVSPIGNALIGKKVGEKISVVDSSYKIIEIKKA